MKTIKEIDTSSDVGKILLVALARLSQQGEYAKKEPDEILQIISKQAEEMNWA